MVCKLAGGSRRLQLHPSRQVMVDVRLRQPALCLLFVL